MRTSIGVLVVASLVFYGAWVPEHIFLLLASIFVNFAFGEWICRLIDKEKGRNAKTALILGVAFNLVLLGWYKYIGFLNANFFAQIGMPLPLPSIVLPLAISFFTFNQIAYLVDCQRGKVRERSLVNYILFVTWFPHLISGPIVHHAEMMPQFADNERMRLKATNLITGCVYILIGLFKKLVIAEEFSAIADPLFDVADTGVHLATQDAWIAAVGFAIVIYFDFSAYMDMALGSSKLFGIELPVNFNSPYKATSIIDFWRRWHITLSRFLRDYLYFSLGGNRKGVLRRHLNLVITMLLGGLWHGASWNFVIWGGLHGIYLMINHGFRHASESMGLDRRIPFQRELGWLLTMLAVLFAWVLFRAQTLDGAMSVWSSMVGIDAGIPRIEENIQLVFAKMLCLILIVKYLPNSDEMIRWLERWIARDSKSVGGAALEGFSQIRLGYLYGIANWRLVISTSVTVWAVFIGVMLVSLKGDVTPFIYTLF